MKQILFSLTLLSLAFCGGDDSSPALGVDAGDQDQPPVAQENLKTLEGVVWVPGNAPTLVPPGHELPVFDAVVYISSTKPDPIPEGVHCQACTIAPNNSVTSDHDGFFSLSRVPPGEHWLIVEKGLFRSERRINVLEDGSNTMELSWQDTVMPSAHDPENGAWIPKIALAGAQFDPIESILGKLGIGEVDASGRFLNESAAGVLDLYSNGSTHVDEAASESLSDLVRDLDKMMSYQIIFIGCSGSQNSDTLRETEVLRNIRDYVAAGGKLYVTDWSGEWVDNVFPKQMVLGSGSGANDGVDTPGEAYDAETDTWDVNLFGDADGSSAGGTQVTSSVRDVDLSQWMQGQVGPITAGAIGALDPGSMQVTGTWTRINGLYPNPVGVDEETGEAIVDVPKKYVVGDAATSANPELPMTITMAPAGCGRVLYSTYHTAETDHVGLFEQERILVYLIMELAVCKDGPIVE